MYTFSNGDNTPMFVSNAGKIKQNREKTPAADSLFQSESCFSQFLSAHKLPHVVQVYICE